MAIRRKRVPDLVGGSNAFDRNDQLLEPIRRLEGLVINITWYDQIPGDSQNRPGWEIEYEAD